MAADELLSEGLAWQLALHKTQQSLSVGIMKAPCNHHPGCRAEALPLGCISKKKLKNLT